MVTPHFPETAWRTSSFSEASANCVQVARTTDVVAARDSKNPAGPRLTMPGTAWTVFIEHVTG